MTDDEPTDEEPDDPRSKGADGVTRRRLLLGGGGAIAAVGGGRAAYNTVLGYGHFGMGTNLREQELEPLVTDRLSMTYDERIEGTRVRFEDSIVVDSEEETRFSLDADRSDVAVSDGSIGADGRLEALFADLSAFDRGEYTFEFSQPEEFFERVGKANARPEIVAAIRSARDRTTDPDVVERFAEADPTDVSELVDGLVEGFRRHTSYDVPRYLAGSIEDNVVFGAHDLRGYFEDDVGFESLIEADGTGIFCWELVFRSIEALHAVSPSEQTVPVAACYVSDRRHKHAYTGVISAIREDGELRFPMTFLDYTYSTLYDDLRLTSIRGEGLAAYDTGHRADEIYYW